MLRLGLLVNAVFLPVCVTCARADPGAVTWAGGTLVLQESHPSIHLVEEHLVFEPTFSATEVTADLWFKNQGPSTVVQMGFPTTAYGGPGYHFVTHLVVECDDREVATEKVKAPAMAGGRPDAQWYVFGLTFQANQARHVRVTYDQTHTSGESRTPYILATGASWAGPIERLTVEIRMGDRRNFSGISLKPSHDGDELPLTRNGHSLFWDCSGYDGDPPVLWLRYNAGAAKLEVVQENGRHEVANAWHPLMSKVRWHRGALLGEAEFLSDILAAKLVRGGWLEKEDLKYRGECWSLPAKSGQELSTFLRLPEACEAFGATVDVTYDEDGDAHMLVQPPPMTVDAARKTASWRSQDPEHRLSALRFLAQEAPHECVAACQKLLSDCRKPAVILAAAGHVAECGDVPLPLPQAAARVASLCGPEAAGPIAELVLSAEDDTVIRGGGLVLRELVGERAPDELLSRVRPDDNHNRWPEYQPRGRAAGLALRRVKDKHTWQAYHRFAVAHEGSELCEAGMVALGFLGDDAAIAYLVEAATDTERDNRDERAAAVTALTCLRTTAGVQALGALSLSDADRSLRHRALMGLEAAIGYSEDGCRFHVPEWAVDISPREAARLAKPCLEKLVAEKADTGRSNQSILAKIDELLQGVGG